MADRPRVDARGVDGQPHPAGGIAISGLLRPLVEHGAWATRTLLDACEALSPEQLATAAPNTFGTIFETLHHVVESDGHYAHRVAPHLWPADLASDANDAWEASLGGPSAFEWVRTGGPESERIQRRRTAFLTGDLTRAFLLLRARASAVAQVWLTFADSEPDLAARCTMWASPVADAETSIAAQVLQSVSHGHEHREQVRAALSTIGIAAPDVSGLAWAESVGDVVSRARP